MKKILLLITLLFIGTGYANLEDAKPITKRFMEVWHDYTEAACLGRLVNSLADITVFLAKKEMDTCIDEFIILLDQHPGHEELGKEFMMIVGLRQELIQKEIQNQKLILPTR